MSGAPHGESTADAAPVPYRGPDRRGVARFVVPARAPTLALTVIALGFVLTRTAFAPRPSPVALTELGAIAATLGVLGGIACVLRWRIDGIARGWWCGWALVVIGLGQLALDPVRDATAEGIELMIFAIGAALFARAVFGPEVDTTIRPLTTGAMILGVALAAIVPAALVRESGAVRIASLVLGGLWLGIATGAVVRRRAHVHDIEAGWIIPVAVALGYAELVPLMLGSVGARLLADRSFELASMALAAVGALGGLVRAAVHHRTRALRERIEHERELANRRRVEESFADRLHELRSTVVALEGGVATLPDGVAQDETAPASAQASLRAALIAEIRRLRTLVNEAPVALGVEAFDVATALGPTVELARRNGQRVDLHLDEDRSALGRPDEIAQVVHGLLTNAAKYAPGAPVDVSIEHQLDEIAIRVADHGPGIDPEYWDLVFDRGFRVDPGAAPGSGLGLAVARKVIRSQDGDLWVEETVGGGATFVISIPAAPALRVVPERAEGEAGSTPAPARDAPAIPMQEAR